MARASKTGGKASRAKPLKAKGIKKATTIKSDKAKSANTERRIVPVAKMPKHHSIAGLTKELKEAREQQAATAEIFKVINSSPGDLTPVFEIILEKAHSLCDVSTGGLEFYEGDIARSVATRGMNERWQQYLRQGYRITEVLRPAYQTLRPGHVVDMRKLVERFPDEPTYRGFVEIGGLRTFLAVPLVKDGIVFGRIVAARDEVRPFTDEQIALLQTFADQAVIAIQNARMFNETKEALERQAATADVLRVISGSVADTAPVFAEITRSCERLFTSGVAGMMLIGDDGLMHHVAWGQYHQRIENADDLIGAQFPRPVQDSIHGYAIQKRRVLNYPDVANGADVPKGLQRTTELIGHNYSIMVAPMLWEDRGIGALQIVRAPPMPFSEKDMSMLQTFADQAVIAIQNARMFNETKEALEQQTATADILKVIASSPNDVQPVFQAIADRSNRLVNGLSTAVCIKIDDMVHLAAFTATNPAADAALKATFPVPMSAVNFMILVERGEIYRIPDTEDVEQVRDIARLRGFRSMLFVPLMRDGELIGVISQTRRDPGPFNDSHVQLLLTFADQAVIAISNVRLFQEVQERTRELSNSLDELRAAQDRLVQTEKLASLGQLTAGIAHEIKNPLNFVNNFSALSVELIAELREALSSVQTSDENRKDIDELATMLTSNVEKIESHGKRADSIVKNMLLHSRDSSGEHRFVDINAILEESLNLAYHGARAEKSGFNITLKRDLDPKAGMVDLYPQEITRVFLNLITNGFYAASKRKATTTAMDFEPALSVATKDIGNAVEIRIRDNGTGIPDDVKEKMFNPFFTTKPAGEGTGLGLSMSHDIVVKQHRGRIDVETQPDAFTEFLIVLPRLGAASENQESKP